VDFDLKTALIQAFNFFVLVFILYKLLYKPVRNTMKAREAQIQKRYDEADGKIKDAEKARAEAEGKQHEIDAQRTALLDEAKQAATERGEALLDEARGAADQMVERAREAVRREWRQAADALGETLGRTVVALCAKALEASGASLGEHAVGEVIEAIGRLEGGDLDEARRAAEHGPVKVLAAGALSDDAQQKLGAALAAKVGRRSVPLEVEEDASLVAGVEVALGTLRVRSHWRQRLEEALAASRDEIAAAAPQPAKESAKESPTEAPTDAAAEPAKESEGE